MRKLFAAPVVLALLTLANAAWAWHLEGHIFCADTGLPLGGVSVQVISTDGGGFTGTGISDENGFYAIGLPDQPGCFEASVVPGAGESVVSPASNASDFCTTDIMVVGYADFVVSSPACQNEGCWLTAGGAKFSSITGTLLGQSNTTKANKLFNWGGNVNPGCSPTAGQGGQFNLLDTVQKLHFHGTAIQVIRCGNVDGIPPGSTSPATPFNFIEFQGTGNVQGMQGNKVSLPLVYFFGRAEDRNEPGSTGQRDGAGKDRLFMNVYTNPADPVGSSMILVDMDGNPATVDPLVITDGNLQIHVSSCSAPTLALYNGTINTAQIVGRGLPPATSLPAEISFAPPSPNPTIERAILRYALPHEARVSLAVFDVAGRTIRQLENGIAVAGQHSTSWDLRDASGDAAPRGIYFVRLAVDDQVFTRTMTIGR